MALQTLGWFQSWDSGFYPHVTTTQARNLRSDRFNTHYCEIEECCNCASLRMWSTEQRSDLYYKSIIYGRIVIVKSD